MRVCERTKKLIDESHRPDLLPVEAAAHVEACAECRLFADERASLRALIASGARVGVPPNFDAVLNKRLADAMKRQRYSWLNAGLYLKLGAATAVLLIAVVLIPRSPKVVAPHANVGPPPAALAPRSGTERIVVPAVASNENEPKAETPRPRYAALAPRRQTYLGETGVLLVRGETGDVEVPVRTVSLGAQPLFYGADGNQGTRNVRASF